MATSKKNTKSNSKTSTFSKIEKSAKNLAKITKIPGYGALTAGKMLDDVIEKRDPNLAKSKTYGAVKNVAKKAKGTVDYVSDSLWDLGKGALDVVTNPGKYIEKGAKEIGKAAYRGGKAVDDFIERVDPSLSKSKLYGAIKGTAKKAPKAIETGVGVAGKAAVALSPFKAASIALSTREAAKGAKKVIKPIAKGADDYVERNDPNLAKSKTYGAVKDAAKSVLGVKSGSTSNKSTSKVASKLASNAISKVASKVASAKPATTAKTTTTSTKTSSPSVSQLWQQKTGTSWSEAKKQGLTDGSLSSNMALMKKLKSGQVSKSSLSKPTTTTNTPKTTTTPTTTPTKVSTPYGGSGIGALERADRENQMRRGGMVRRMKTGGMVNSNSKVSVIKSAGSKGVKVGANTRATAARAAKGRVGRISKAPRTATPKAKMVMSVRRRR